MGNDDFTSKLTFCFGLAISQVKEAPYKGQSNLN
jgi:hypothetical protein